MQAMTSALLRGGVLLRLEYPNGKTAELYLCELGNADTLWRLSVMSAHWGIPVICMPLPTPEAA